jgi:hypothetical protein
MKIWVLLVLLNGEYIKVGEFKTQKACIEKQQQVTKKARRVSLCFANYRIDEVEINERK